MAEKGCYCRGNWPWPWSCERPDVSRATCADCKGTPELLRIIDKANVDSGMLEPLAAQSRSFSGGGPRVCPVAAVLDAMHDARVRFFYLLPQCGPWTRLCDGPVVCLAERLWALLDRAALAHVPLRCVYCSSMAATAVRRMR